MKEKDLVNQFEALSELADEYEFLHKETAPNPAVSHMDIEFIYDNKYVRAEAKHSEDYRNQSQSALSVFGSILKGRNLPLAKPQKVEGREIVYALVLHQSLVNVYKGTFSKISESDWKTFGEQYELEYVFVVSDEELNVCSWNAFYSDDECH